MVKKKKIFIKIMMNQWQRGGIMFGNLGDKRKRKQRKEKNSET